MLNKSFGTLKVFNTWTLLECDDQIGAMYRSLYSLEYFYKPAIQKPLWGTHISVIRGECVLDVPLKMELDGMRIQFIYVSCMETNGCHFWLPVICPLLDSIRESFNLGPTIVGYHMSIGNLRNVE